MQTNDHSLQNVNLAELLAQEGYDIADLDLDGIDISDLDLDLIAGGVGPISQRVVSGALAATLAVGALPMNAFAKGSKSGGGGAGSGGAQTTRTIDAAELAEIKYQPDFLLSDIATPEGVKATAQGLVVSGKADENTLASLKEECSSSVVNWENSSKAVDYTVEALGYVDEDAGKVAQYGSHIFNIIKGGFTGDFGSIFNGSTGILKLIGIIGPGETEKKPGVTTEELKKDVQSLRDLCNNMSNLLEENVTQTYQNRLTTFDTAIDVLDTDCGTAERMFKKADKLVKERGLADQMESKAPGDLQLPPAPERPARPTQPDQPVEPTLPAEPAAPELPAEPVAPSEQDENYQQLLEQYNADHEAWQAECDRLNVEYQTAHDEWQAECDRLTGDYQKALDEYNSFSLEEATRKWEDDYTNAVTDWIKECDRIGREREAQQKNYNMDYSALIVKTMEDEQKAGNRDFKNFDTLMQNIEANFKLVASECGKAKGSSPFHAYDSYWNHYFNFDTQGYYLRRAYRAAAEFSLKRSYALIATYYDMGHYNSDDAEDGDVREPLNELLRKGLNGIDAMPAGTSPEDVIKSGTKRGLEVDNKPISLHCNTFNWDITLAKVGAICDNPGATDDQIELFKSRLHGRTIKEDLELAGIVPDVVSHAFNDFDVKYNRDPYRDFNNAEGIVMRTWTKDLGNYLGQNGVAKRYYAKMLLWDGTVKDLTTCTQDHVQWQPEAYYPHWFLELRH